MASREHSHPVGSIVKIRGRGPKHDAHRWRVVAWRCGPYQGEERNFYEVEPAPYKRGLGRGGMLVLTDDVVSKP